MHLGGVARSAGGAERKSRGREGEKFLIYTGPEGKPGGESRFPLSFKTNGVCNTKLKKKKNKKKKASLGLFHTPLTRVTKKKEGGHVR